MVFGGKVGGWLNRLFVLPLVHHLHRLHLSLRMMSLFALEHFEYELQTREQFYASNTKKVQPLRRLHKQATISKYPNKQCKQGALKLSSHKQNKITSTNKENLLPVPNFAALEDVKALKLLSPLSSKEKQLPPPVSHKTPKSFMSPKRVRTPGTGILSPSVHSNGRCFSPSFKTGFQSFDDSEVEFSSESFQILAENCAYDSDDYRDFSFPRWVRMFTELDLRCSNKFMYDEYFAPRNIQDLQVDQVLNRTSSCDTGYSKSHATIESFEIGRPIGAGKFGTIYLARAKRDAQLVVAIKVMYKTSLTANHIHQIIREVKHLDTLRSENIIHLYDFFHDEDRVYLVMEYANGGDLYQSLCDRRNFSEIEASRVFVQAVRAIQVCHDHGIIHRDIKPENFVWGVGNVLKLIDFGWSAPCGAIERRKTLCGTLDYLPPEMISNRSYDRSIDIWCLGVLLYELVTGAPPFEDENFLVTKLNIKYVSYSIPNYVSVELADLIRSILQNDATMRPSIEEILAHPWIILTQQVL